MNKALLLALAMLSFGAATRAQNYLPEPADLQAAYCMGFYRASPLRSGPDMEAYLKDRPAERADLEAARKEGERNMERLRSYLIPRIGSLDSTGLITAAQQGEKDFQSLDWTPAGLERSARCRALAFLPY